MFDDTFQRKGVHSRQWRFVTYDGISFSEKTIRQSSNILDMQTANGIVVSEDRTPLSYPPFFLVSCTRDTQPTQSRWPKVMWIVSIRQHLKDHLVISCFMELCLSHSSLRPHFSLFFSLHFFQPLHPIR